MKKYIKKVLALTLSATFAASMSTFVMATENNSYVPSEYLETHVDIDMRNIDVFITDKSELQISVADNLSMFKRSDAKSDAESLQDYFARYPQAEDDVIEMITNDKTLIAMGYTEAPLQLVGDHYERIPATVAATRGAASTDESIKYGFSMSTYVNGGDYLSTGSKYAYTSNTYGYWSNSILSGEKYPAPGEDYILQAIPSNANIRSDRFSASYDNSPMTGVLGTDFSRENGDANYVRWALVDDPPQYRQVNTFSLGVDWESPITSDTRYIRSYYVHTWDQISLSVSASVSYPWSVSLSLTPSVSSKQWQLYNYVVFNF